MADFKFSIADLMSDDTSGTDSNPFYRENMKGLQTPLVTSNANTFTKGGGTDWSSYQGNSVIDMSNILMNVPIVGNASALGANTANKYDLLASGHAPSKAISNIFGSLTTAGSTIGAGNNSVINTPATQATNQAAATAATSGGPTLSNTGPVDVVGFVSLAVEQTNKPYVWGATGTSSFDCSGLIYYCLHSFGSVFSAWPHFSGAQYAVCKAANLGISVTQGINTYGALLFAGSGSDPAGDHVAISMGDGIHVMEAATSQAALIQSSTYAPNQIGIHIADLGFFDVAATIPNINYAKAVYGKGIGTGTPAPSQSSTS